MQKPPVLLPVTEVKLTLSREIVKRKARYCLSRSSYRLFSFICLGIALIALAGLFFDNRPEMQSIYPLYLFFPILPFVVYGWRYWAMTRIRHKDLNRTMTIQIGMNGITLDRDETTVVFRWPAIKRLWKFPDLFLLSPEKSGLMFIIIPTENISAETKSFMEMKVREHGGSVV